jgi:hypothetical protein
MVFLKINKFSISLKFSVRLVVIACLLIPLKSFSRSPVKCHFGIYTKTLRINQAEETFETFFYWWLRVDSIQTGIDYSFVKDFEFINAEVEMFDFDAADSLNGYYYVAGRCKAVIPYKADYKRFPFDVQQLHIAIESTAENKNALIYIPDYTTKNINNIRDENIEILNGDQYSIKSLNAIESRYIYRTNFGDPQVEGNEEYSRLEFHIGIERNPAGIIQKISLPLFVVLILAYLVFYIPDHEIGTASGLTVTALLAAIAFQWTLNDALPKVSYLTLIDKIFYLVYAYIFYAMAQTVFTFNLSNKSNYWKNVSIQIEFHSRYLFPLTFIAFLLLIAA